MHWTTTLKTENDVLKSLLKSVLDSNKAIVNNRFMKINMNPTNDDYDLGYTACVQEFNLRLNELDSDINDSLVQNSISL